MARLLVLIHTVPPLIGVFDRLTAQILPGVQVKHILDEPLLEAIRLRGRVDRDDAERLLSHVRQAEQIGAQAVLVTCSTTSPLVEDIQAKVSIPVYKIDQAMIEKAVQLGTRIGVLATNQTTLAPNRQMLLAQAAKAGKKIEYEENYIEGALEALLKGQAELHDRLVMQAILEIRPTVDVVVLAQASMARALETGMVPNGGVPVLSSPQLALKQIAHIFQKLNASMETKNGA
jgi:Asp/Glu/hydantoin racemase